MNEKLKKQFDSLQYNADAIEKLYARLNQVYGSIDLKTGLISSGFTGVMAVLLSYLGKLKK